MAATNWREFRQWLLPVSASLTLVTGAVSIWEGVQQYKLGVQAEIASAKPHKLKLTSGSLNSSLTLCKLPTLARAVMFLRNASSSCSTKK